jgi:predicted ATP-dependent Lon-type protease
VIRAIQQQLTQRNNEQEIQSGVDKAANYIAEQDEHHRKRSYSEELKRFVERYGPKWRDYKTVERLT